MILVLLAGGWLGWLAHGARLQRQAVVVIERDGGMVVYDWQYAGGKIAGGYVEAGRPWAPRWMVDLLGPDYFGTVISAQFEGGATDRTLLAVSRLGRLEQLTIALSEVTDGGMVPVSGLTRLRDLNLQESAVGDPGMEHLASLPRLQSVVIPRNLTDDGLVRLARVTSLRALYINSADASPHITAMGVGRFRSARPDVSIKTSRRFE